MRISIIGGGPVGLTMALDLILKGHEPMIWVGSIKKFQSLHPDITFTGALGAKKLRPHITESIDDIASHSNLLIICTKASDHRTIARLLAVHLNHKKTIILVPGRTFGCLEFRHELLKNNRCISKLPVLAECQTTPFSCRYTGVNEIKVYAKKMKVSTSVLSLSDLPRLQQYICEADLDYFSIVRSSLITSMNNIGPIMHCPPMLLNVSLVDSSELWARKLRSPAHFYSEFISPALAKLIQNLDYERLTIASAILKKGEEKSILDWGFETYGLREKSFYEALQSNKSYGPIISPNSLNHRYLTEDIPTGLVPWESLAKKIGLTCPLISLLIDLSIFLVEFDFRETGRSLENLHINDIKHLK